MPVRIEKLTRPRVEEAMQRYQTIFGAKQHTTEQTLLERMNNQTGIFYIAVDEATDRVVGLKFGYLEGDTCIGRGTDEGIPFHIASGYQPRALLQFTDSHDREKLNLESFKITSEGYNEAYQVYQIYLELERLEQNLAYLHHLQTAFPTVNVQFVFSKRFSHSGS